MTDWSKDKSWMKESGISENGIKSESFATGVGNYIKSQIIVRVALGIIIYLIIVIGGWLKLW